MARHNIQFTGMRHSPSDITGKDGDLLECVNLVNDGGELKPLETPERLDSLYPGGSDYVLVAVHEVTGRKCFIYVANQRVSAVVRVVDEEGGSVTIDGANIHALSEGTVLFVETIGNTVAVGTDLGIHYMLYKNGEYKWLGDKLPQPVFKFDFRRSGLATDENGDPYGGYYVNEFQPNAPSLYPKEYQDGAPIPGGGIAITYNSHMEGQVEVIDDPTPGGGENNPIVLANDTEENRTIIRDSIRSKIAKAMANMKRGNVFAYPFFVRYAARMYDGNYTMHSAPLLMVPSTMENPLLCYIQMLHLTDDQYVYHVGNDVVCFKGMEMTLRFDGWVDENGQDVGISDWSDIIKGVDIFLSSEISSYDERAWDNAMMFPREFYTFLREDGNGNRTETDYGHCYTRNTKLAWYDIFEKGTNPDEGIFDEDETISDTEVTTYEIYKYYRIPIPTIGEEQMMEKLGDASLFFRVKKYDTESLSEAWQSERRFRSEVPNGTIEKLESLPQLPDDYISRSRMSASVGYSYNQRLILGNIGIQLPLWYQDTKDFQSGTYVTMAITFRVEKPEMTYYIPWTMQGVGLNDFGHYLYYPDPDCTAAIVSNGNSVRIVPMHEHAGLHGAYAIMPGAGSLNENFTSFEQWSGQIPSPSSDRYYNTPNAIAMSEVANPFHFTASNFKDIGRSKVIGIAANTLDVNYNQWGPYPIAVFCNDGIVNVTIDKEGRFGGVDAVGADVLLEPQGLSRPTLVQTGQALVFLTLRGVMTMAGTRIACISGAMEGRRFNAVTDLNPCNPSSAQYNVGAFKDLVGNASDNTPFMEFARTGFLAYDYAHNRVLLMNASESYQYVYGFGTGLWSKQVVYTNGDAFQLEGIPDNTAPSTAPSTALAVSTVTAAVNDYTEMFLQDGSGYLYKTMDVTEENAAGSLYRYGFFVSRPVRLGTDEYKTLVRMLHRYTHYAECSFVKAQVYGSTDGVRYGRVYTLRGMSYRYFIFVIYTYMKPNERYSYLSVDFVTRLTDKLR